MELVYSSFILPDKTTHFHSDDIVDHTGTRKGTHEFEV